MALNAGGKFGANTAFYLPLHRVERALRRLQAGLPVTRGSIQVCGVCACVIE